MTGSRYYTYFKFFSVLLMLLLVLFTATIELKTKKIIKLHPLCY